MRLIPVNSDGWRFIIPLGLGGVFFIWMSTPWSIPLGTLLLLATLFVIFFFRDFNRKTVEDEDLIYSPADGRILDVETLKEGERAGWRLVRIFLSVFNGHIQRSPVTGRIERVNYKKGTFLDARHPNAHIDNEQNEVHVVSDKGTVVIKQIAGLIARRIVCWVKEQDSVSQGQRYGLIRFGSQVDVILPPTTDLFVGKGTKVLGGKTILGKWRS